MCTTSGVAGYEVGRVDPSANVWLQLCALALTLSDCVVLFSDLPRLPGDVVESLPPMADASLWLMKRRGPRLL